MSSELAKAPDSNAKVLDAEADSGSTNAAGSRRPPSTQSAPVGRGASPAWSATNWGPASHGGIMPGSYSPRRSVAGDSQLRSGRDGGWKNAPGGPPEDQSAGNGGNAVPSWHDPTAAQSSKGPSAWEMREQAGGDSSVAW